MSLPLSILLGGIMLIKKIKTYKWQALASLVMTGLMVASSLSKVWKISGVSLKADEAGEFSFDNQSLDAKFDLLIDGYDDTPPIIASTGPILIYRGDVFTSTNGAGGFDKGTNDLTAVAERQYVIAFNPDDAYFVKVSTDPGTGKYVARQF